MTGTVLNALFEQFFREGIILFHFIDHDTEAQEG
jgi:hypothetical protein